MPFSPAGSTAAVLDSKWSEQAIRVLEERYLLKDEAGKVIETPDEMCWRVAGAVADAELGIDVESGHFHKTQDKEHVLEYVEWRTKFFSMMATQRFMPNSPTLMNAGKGNNQQLSACFVLPIEDSITGIFNTIRDAAIIHKSGGGTGFSFSRLRPNGSRVLKSQGVASGPVSFLRVFDAATEAIKQGGTRRGANMAILRVDHPDIAEFIDCKLDGGITNFNISVGITDLFMKALEQGGGYDLVSPRISPAPGDTSAQEASNGLSAQYIWDKIVSAAHQTGDPGLIFLDRINESKANPTPGVGEVEATNPCGEQPLLPYEACNLGSINLAKFITPPEGQVTAVDYGQYFDWDALGDTVHTAVRFLDDVITINPYPLPEIHEMVKANRRIGLGVMGWADTLMLLLLPYDSPPALALAERVAKFIDDAAFEASAALAAERGPFPNFAESIYSDGVPLRNSTRTTIAPTGSISIIADCSSGIEPIFALAYQHKGADGRVLDFVNPFFKRRVEALSAGNGVARGTEIEAAGHTWDDLWGFVRKTGTAPRTEEAMGAWGDNGRTVDVFKTAHEIAPAAHVAMQAAWQAHTDNAVSKTINLPNDATVADVGDAYDKAWRTGCLGITVFRDGSKDRQVLNAGVAPEAPEAASGQAVEIAAPDGMMRERDEVVQGYTRNIPGPEGNIKVTINSDADGVLEIFINVGRAGSDIAAMAEAIGRMVSLNLRMHGSAPNADRIRDIAEQLQGIGGSRSVGFGPNQVLSLPDAVAKALLLHHGRHARITSPIQDEDSTQLPDDTSTTGNLCPECQNTTIYFQEGCKKCVGCGYSAC